jgi:YD repeat-containing protein
MREVNGLGELVRVTDHLGSVLTYEYDALGNVVRSARQTYDGKSAQSTAGYDALGRKTTMTDPDTGARSYSYNALGEIIQTTAANSCERSWYDGAGRVYSRINYASASCGGVQDASTTWHYDIAANGIGQLYSVVHNDETTSFSRTHSYDGFGRSRDVTTTLGGSDYVQSSTYDQFGRPFQNFFSGTNLPRSGELTQYNERGHVTTLRNAFPGTIGQAYRELLQADAAGRPQRERRYGNDNLVIQRDYDPSTGRNTSIVTGGLQSLSYQYDPLGNMSWREDRSGGGYLREEFGYDSLQRLTSTYARQANGSAAFVQSASYDGLGNFVGQTTGSKPTLCNAADESAASATAATTACARCAATTRSASTTASTSTAPSGR